MWYSKIIKWKGDVIIDSNKKNSIKAYIINAINNKVVTLPIEKDEIKSQ